MTGGPQGAEATIGVGVIAAIATVAALLIGGANMMSGPNSMGMMGGGMMGGCNMDGMADSMADTMDIDPTQCQAMMQGTMEMCRQRCQSMAGEIRMTYEQCHAMMDQG